MNCLFICISSFKSARVSRKEKMAHVGGNLVHRPQDNGYLDGIISQITTQSEVTLNVMHDAHEVSGRKKNLQTRPGRIYGGAEVAENHYILPGELVFGWVNKQGRNSVPGNPNFNGWTALNGVPFGSGGSNEELQNRIRFIGLAKTPYFWDKPDQPKHGCAVIAFGTGTTHHTGTREFFPGDDAIFSVVAQPLSLSSADSVNRPYPGGQFGDYGPGTRVGNPRAGTSRSKLRMLINPARVKDMRPTFNPVLAAFRKTRREGGIADIPIEHMEVPPTDGSLKPTPVQEQAMLLGLSTAVSLVAGLEYLAGAAPQLVQLFAQPAAGPGGEAARQMAVIERLGVFKTSLNERALLNDLIDCLYVDHASNKASSRRFLEQIKSSFKDNIGKEGTSNERRFTRARLGLSNIQTLGYARAVHAVQRTKVGKITTYAKPGNRVDIFVGACNTAF